VNELLKHTSAKNQPTEKAEEFGTSVMNGLTRNPKTIECKWLYDADGSDLFDAITELEEYYPTRIEVGILRKSVHRLKDFIKAGTTLLELGSGSCFKTRILLNELTEISQYVPVDISEDYIEESIRELRTEYPNLRLRPICSDFTQPIALTGDVGRSPKLLFFPGSTIGNLDFQHARRFLSNLRTIDNVDAFVIGFDLRKDLETLLRAYDDAAGVTAAFNLNLLHRINRELGACINTEAFRHEARWNENLSRIEMHLVSKKAQHIEILGSTIEFQAGESIHTESSYKFSVPRFRDLASQAGWATRDVWTDQDNMFAMAVLS
jgi:dimethylhistidine N-methyltransferase